MSADSLIPWTDADDRLPEDEFQWLKLRCSDGRDRYGYCTRWPDGSFAGWMVDGLRDFVEEITLDSYHVTSWMPSDIPEPEMEMPV